MSNEKINHTPSKELELGKNSSILRGHNEYLEYHKRAGTHLPFGHLPFGTLAMRQLPFGTLAIWDSCHVTHLPLWTFAIMDTCHSGYLPFEDTCHLDTCHLGHLPLWTLAI